MKKYFFERAYLTEGQRSGWEKNVLVAVDDKGFISSVTSNVSGLTEEKITGFAIPSFPNTHSHAFQKALAGRTEYINRPESQGSQKDNFWTWRDLMYQFANALTPDDLKNIAAFLYLEMVKAGYSSVAEFHYLHHQPGGRPYDNPAEMSYAILQAAEEVGIGLTHLPVLYMQGGFNHKPLEDNQLRFHHDVEAYLRLLDSLHGTIGKYSPHHNLGVAFHSLRAVPEEALSEVMAVLDRKYKDMPVHIHIAEQLREVEDCLEYTGQRPVDWLMSHHNVDHRWCLVHATHMTAGEVAALAKSAAVASICTTTEANLGDGFFPVEEFLGLGGEISVGSDSNSLISPLEEIRWLEYGARLVRQQRNIAANEDDRHTGSVLFRAVQKGGARALGQKTGALKAGHRADIIILDRDASPLSQVPEEYILDAMIFSGHHSDIKHVMVAGKWSVKDRHHAREQDIAENYKKTLGRLKI